MKIFLTLFVLFFSSSVISKDIADFQIEGISIGDSLLDYFSEEEILKNKRFYNEDKKFISSEFLIDSKDYEVVGAYYKNNDKIFTIHGIIGFNFYDKINIKNCYKKTKEIINSFEDFQNDSEWVYDEYEDVDGFFTFNTLNFKSGVIQISCFDWNLEVEKKFNWTDHLRVKIASKELEEWWISIDTTYND